jgi:hypothetical protein
MKRTVTVVLCLAGIAGCVAGEPAPTERTLDTGAPPDAIDHVVIPASEESRAELGVEEWLVYAVADEERYALVGRDAEGNAVETVEILGEASQVTMMLGGTGVLVVDQTGTVVENTIAETQQRFLGLAAEDLERNTPYNRACAVWVATLAGLSVACGAGAWPACIGIPVAFCNASRYCGNNVCDF